jgi:HEPN domain-containing protein
MKIKDVIEWFEIAEDDLYSAQILYEQVRKPYEIICYHCAQSTEKYLKGFLTYNDVIPEKTHNLLLLLELCIGRDVSFGNIRTECSLLNKFTNEIRYPHKIEINKEDVDYSVNAVKRIKSMEPIKKIIDIVNSLGKSP